MIKLCQERKFLVLNLRHFNYEAGMLIGSKVDTTTCKDKHLVKLNHHILENKHISNESKRNTNTIGCPTRYRTRYFFNNFTTNEDIATKVEFR